MKTLLTTLLLTLLLINNAIACSIDFSKEITYCSGGWLNSTGELKKRAVCSVSKDAIAAQIELAQRYRDGYQPKGESDYVLWNGIMRQVTVSSSLYLCGEPDPEKDITPNQSMADYWTKFSSVTQVVLLARNGDADSQLKLGHFYLDGDEAGNMIDQFQYSPDLYHEFPNLKLHKERAVQYRSEQAYFWFKKSAEQGNVEAKEKVIELKKYLKNK